MSEFPPATVEDSHDPLDEFFILEQFHGRREALRDILRKDSLSKSIVKAFLCLPYEENLSERERIDAKVFAGFTFTYWRVFKLEWRFCKDEVKLESESEKSHYFWVIDDCFKDRMPEPRRPIFFGLFSVKMDSVPHRNLTEFLAICREYYKEYEPDGSLVNP